MQADLPKMTEETLLNYLSKFRDAVDLEMRNDPKTFQFTDDNLPVIINLIKYATGHESSLDYRKGILLRGEKGLGKTTILKALSRIAVKESQMVRMVMARAENIGNAYKIHGPAIFDTYRVNFIDDILREEKTYSYFGEPLDVIHYLLDQHYHWWQTRGTKLFVTLNGNKKLLKDRYEHRTQECLYDMSNIIHMDGNNWRITNEE